MTPIYVDVHAPGSATIAAGDHRAHVDTAGPRRYYIEDEDTKSVIGYASSYKAAAHKYARHLGLTNPQIEITYEYWVNHVARLVRVDATATRPHDTIYVDVHAPGSATIVAGSHWAHVGTDGPRRYYIEDEDTEEIIGYASSYKAAALRYAQHLGLTNPQIEITYEYRP